MRGDPARRAVNLARRLAVDAGKFLLSNLHRARRISDKSGFGNLVTEMDVASEKRILREIRRAFPDDEIVAEESGTSGHAENRWYVDPLDGTANYAHGFPLFCVSIAYEMKGRLEAGVVYCPALDELYVGRRGHGSTCNGRRLKASGQKDLSRSMLC